MSCGGPVASYNWKQHELRSAYVSLSDLRSRNDRPADLFVTISDGELPLLRVDLYADSSSESAVFQDAIAWHDHVFVGFGHTAPSHTKRDEIPLKEEERRSGWRNQRRNTYPSGSPMGAADQTRRRRSGRRAERQFAQSPLLAQFPTHARGQRRFKIEVDITINSRTCGVLKGYTVDMSESGIAAMLRIEVPLGEVVELDFALPCGPVTVQAIGRQRNAFRYGLELALISSFIRGRTHSSRTATDLCRLTNPDVA